MLTGFFKSSESLERCVEKLDRFEETSFAQLISDQAKPIRYKVKATYLYCSKSQKKYRTFQPAKGSLTQVNKEITTFDRFLVLGVPETPHVMISFLKTPAASKQALRFSNHVAPGDNVYVIMPRVISYLGPQNPEVLTSDPIFPIASTALLQRPILPPADVDAPNYTFFDFVTHSLDVFSATPQDNVCTGTFCDSQTITASCACTATDPHKHWALCVTFTCDQFSDVARDHVSLTSKRASAFFIAEEKLQWPLTNETIDPFDLDDAVRQLTELVNNSQGFRIKGWFKPAVADNGVTQETFSLHTCFLAPNGPLTAEQHHAIYNNPLDNPEKPPPKQAKMSCVNAVVSNVD